MMTIEQQALALVNEVRAERKYATYDLLGVQSDSIFIALVRALERHEAFRQEVSEAVKFWTPNMDHTMRAALSRFIIVQPVDPDVQIVRDILHAHQRALPPPDSGWGDMSYAEGSYDHLGIFKAALAAYKVAKHGLQITGVET